MEFIQASQETYSSTCSVSWVCSEASSWWDVPGTPRQGGVQEASSPGAQVNSAGWTNTEDAAEIVPSPPSEDVGCFRCDEIVRNIVFGFEITMCGASLLQAKPELYHYCSETW